MAGVLSTARRPFDDLATEINENREKQHRENPDKSEMVKLTMELFGDAISLEALRKVGENEEAARIASFLVAGQNHDFDDPEFKAKLDRFMDMLRGRDDAPFEVDEIIVKSIEALHEENDFGGRQSAFTAEQDLKLYVEYNKLGADQKRNVRKHDVKKHVVIAGKAASAVNDRVQSLRTSLNKLGARRGQGAIGDKAFEPRYKKRDRKVRLTSMRYIIHLPSFASSPASRQKSMEAPSAKTTSSLT